MAWNKLGNSGRMLVQTLGSKGLTPIRVALIAGVLMLIAFPFVLPFTGASGSPLLQVSPTPPPGNGTLPRVAFSDDTSNASESVTPANLEVTLSSASSSTVTVGFAVTGGTATGGGVDYTLAAGTLTFIPGDTSENIAIAVVDDAVDEASENIVVTLSSPVNAVLGAQASHTYTIEDNDGPPSVAFATGSSSAGESVSPANLEVTLSGPSSLTVTVDFEVTGGTASSGGVDFTLAAGTLTFAPGDVSENISINIVDDAVDEDDETIVVTLSNPTNAVLGGLSAHTYTVQDNEGVPTVAFASASSSASESVTPAVLEVRLSEASARPVTVDFEATGGTATGMGYDYTLAAGTLTFAAGDVSENISIAIVDDALDEVNETIIVTLSNSANAALGSPSSHTYTIEDNDGAPSVAFAAASSSASEAVSPASLEVKLSAPSTLPITVAFAVTGGTATGGGVDYTLAAGTLTFAKGDVNEVIDVTIINDALDEADETIVVTLSSPTNANLGTPSAHTYIIKDNDDDSNGGGQPGTGTGNIIIGDNNNGVIIIGDNNTVGNVKIGNNGGGSGGNAKVKPIKVDIDIDVDVDHKKKVKQDRPRQDEDDEDDDGDDRKHKKVKDRDKCDRDRDDDDDDDDNGRCNDNDDRKLTKEVCKKGGWKNFTSPSFKNQGQCVRYFVGAA